MDGHSNGVFGLEFSPDGTLLASGSQDDGLLIFWDPDSGLPLLPPITADQFGVYSVAFSPDGTMLATGGAEDALRLWHAEAGSENFGRQIGPSLEANQKDINRLAFHPQEPLLASAGADQTIILWDIDPESPTFGQPLAEPLTGHETAVWGLSFDPGGRKLATSETFQGVKLMVWDLESNPPEGEQMGVVASPEERFLATLDFSPIEPLLAVGSMGELSFWDTNDESPSMWAPVGQPIPAGQSIAVFEGKFSPDGSLLAAGAGNRLLLVDAAGRQQIGPALDLHSPTTNLLRLAFNPDGSLLASGGLDGSMFLWAADLESWIDIACGRANRNLTQEEWSQFFGREAYRATCPGLPAG